MSSRTRTSSHTCVTCHAVGIYSNPSPASLTFWVHRLHWQLAGSTLFEKLTRPPSTKGDSLASIKLLRGSSRSFARSSKPTSKTYKTSVMSRSTWSTLKWCLWLTGKHFASVLINNNNNNNKWLPQTPFGHRAASDQWTTFQDQHRDGGCSDHSKTHDSGKKNNFIRR